MAANMPMATNGQLMMQHQQQQQQQHTQMMRVLYGQILKSAQEFPAGGWQATIPPNERLAKITNMLVIPLKASCLFGRRGGVPRES
jgi:hypothetical protein